MFTNAESRTIDAWGGKFLYFTEIFTCNMYSITDDVPANNTIWVLGDSILVDAAGHYNFFKKKKDSNIPSSNNNNLYMENMYAIRLVSPGVYTASQAKNVPNIILNSLVDTLNVKAKVPHTLIILINDHRFWNNGDLLTFQMERLFQRFIKEIRRIVEDRNLSLPPRAANWDYPRIFINRALPLPNNMTRPYPKGFKSNRRRYNKLIQRVANSHNYEVINMPEFTCENENDLFSSDRFVTPKGYKQLWIAISDAVHKSDNHHRINMNKIMAKQLAAQISLTAAEIKGNQCTDDDDLSDIDSSDKNLHHEPLTTRPAKWSLITDFNQCDQTTPKKIQISSDTPQSTISEYYTVDNTDRRQIIQGQHKMCGGQWKNHHKPNLQTNHHKPSFRGKRRTQSKNNWRNPHWKH